MKKLFIFLVTGIMAFGLVGCSGKGECTLHISDEARVLSDKDNAMLMRLFEKGVYNEVYLFTVPDSMSYAEAMDYRSPNDKVSWFQRNSVFRVYYFPATKWVRVSVAANRQNDFDRQYALPLYRIQHKLCWNNAPTKDALFYIMRDIASVTSERVSWLSPASSILSVVDWLNEALILPSNNLLHVLFFRAPLFVSLFWVSVFNGVLWPISIMIVLLIALSFARNGTKKHVRIYNLLYYFHMLMLVCLVFLAVPSFDTVYLILDMGFGRAAGILDATYMRAEAMEHTWVGSVLFILLYIAHRVLSYYIPKDALAGDSESEQIDKKANTLADNFNGAVLMFILAFLMPKYIVWAVCAYLVQQIICRDILRQSSPKGKFYGSDEELVVVNSVFFGYFIFLLDWFVCHITNISATYLWASEWLASMHASLGTFWANAIWLIVCLILGAGASVAVILYMVVIWDFADMSTTHFTNAEDKQLTMSKKFIQLIGSTLLVWIASLLCLWMYAVQSSMAVG